MRYALIVLVALTVLSCGADDQELDQGLDVLTTTTVESLPSTTSSPLVTTGSPSPEGSPSATKDLALALPSVETVEDILGSGLRDREVRNDLSQAFEGADFSAITEGVVGLYRGSGMSAYGFIDVASFTDVSAAEAFFTPIREQGDGERGTQQEIDVDGIGDEAKGFVGTVPEEPGAQIGIVYLRVDDVVSIIVVRQPEEDGLADRMRRLAAVVSTGIGDLQD